MTKLTILPAHEWAELTFATAELGDHRRTRRLVQVAAQMAQAPAASLPVQMGGKRADLKATSRLLHEADGRHEALSRPHWQQTREQAHTQQRTVLLVHDDTELDDGYDPAIKGLGPVGNGSHWGFFVHCVLAVVPMGEHEQVLGWADLRTMGARVGTASRQGPEAEQQTTSAAGARVAPLAACHRAGGSASRRRLLGACRRPLC